MHKLTTMHNIVRVGRGDSNVPPLTHDNEIDTMISTKGYENGDKRRTSPTSEESSLFLPLKDSNSDTLLQEITNRHLFQQRPANNCPTMKYDETRSPGQWLDLKYVFQSTLAILNGKQKNSKALFPSWILILILISFLQCSEALKSPESTSNTGSYTNCTFPQRWEGAWFQSGLQQPIHIKGSKLSFRGTCIASDGDKFLMVDDKCRRCVVIYEKHKNVLQYKESECDDMYMDQSNPANAMPIQQMRTMTKGSDINNSNNHNSNGRGAHPNLNGGHSRSSSDPYLFRSNDDIDNCPLGFCKGRESLQNLCGQITGDAPLYSMFKENAEPVRCPLKGPFTFTYNRGHGECHTPVSNIESCTEDSRLLLSFLSCPTVEGTESTVEELTCLATWKDGNSRYLVGLVSHHLATSNEERYRCFVYEKVSGSSSKDAEYKLAQSGDATCNGLDSAEVGSRIMTLKKAPTAERCDFPQWFKGRKHWHSLLGNAGYSFHQSDGSMHINRPNGVMETRALCEQINKQTSTEMMAVVHYTSGCKSGFMCMMFYRRDTHVAEIQMGSPATRLEDACAVDHFDINKLPYITLLASNPESEVCPAEGLYGLRGLVGPPFMASRHKRNHNNNALNRASHNRNYSTFMRYRDTGLRRRHDSLSFRNSETINHNSWHAQTRGVSLRNKRNVDKVLLDRSRRDATKCVVDVNSRRQLLIGCTETNLIEVRPSCGENQDEFYTCHGSWTYNKTVFIIAKHAETQHGVCLSFRPSDVSANDAQLVIGDRCVRGMHDITSQHLVANLTVYDRTDMDRESKCSDTNASMRYILSYSPLIAAAVILIFNFYSMNSFLFS